MNGEWKIYLGRGPVYCINYVVIYCMCQRGNTKQAFLLMHCLSVDTCFLMDCSNVATKIMSHHQKLAGWGGFVDLI